jgi:predicted SprT family Zn-dependent metalloprotease
MAAKSETDTQIETRIGTLLDRWAEIWGVPSLSTDVDIRFSGRLSRSLGRTRPISRRITLAAHLRSPENSSLLKSVLCHEAAHVAVAKLFGSDKKPHGPEWRSLVRRAGHEPTVHIVEEVRPGGIQRRGRIWKYLHRCSVCQAIRVGYRPVTEWRCIDCTELGLSGEMIITRQRINTDAL